jgi:hypothetical protein
MKVEVDVKNVFKPIKNVYGSEKRPFVINNVKSVKFVPYSLTEQKEAIEKYLNRSLPDFDTNSHGLTPMNVVFTSDSQRVTVDFGKLLRDDVNNTISNLIAKDDKTGKTIININSVSYDGSVCTFA